MLLGAVNHPHFKHWIDTIDSLLTSSLILAQRFKIYKVLFHLFLDSTVLQMRKLSLREVK